MSLLWSHEPPDHKEHVWPDWLRDYLPLFSDLGDIERYSPATRRQRWREPCHNDGEGLL
jgi:hypothetical protein